MLNTAPVKRVLKYMLPAAEPNVDLSTHLQWLWQYTALNLLSLLLVSIAKHEDGDTSLELGKDYPEQLIQLFIFRHKI